MITRMAVWRAFVLCAFVLCAFVLCAFVLCAFLAGGTRFALAASRQGTRLSAASADTSPGTSGAAARPSASADSGDDIRDIHGPIAIPGPGSARWYVAAAAGLAVAAAAFVLHAGRRKPVVPAHERALRALSGARALVGGDARAFSVVASEAVRSYLEEAFRIRAPHRTTEELLVDLMGDTSPVAAHRAALGKFLSCCDCAKFGAWPLSRAESEAMLASAEAFIRATAPPLASNHVGTARLRAGGVA